MIHIHGNVTMGASAPCIAYDRFVAVLDVLGMKAWIERENPSVIAETLEVAFAACDQSCSGSVDGRLYGPLLGTTQFSDTLLVWSPDDTWTSFATMCSSIKMIVGVALNSGIPLRGSISLGKTVCNPKTLRFVGPAIVDAFLWSEKERPYKSVGVDITPNTLNMLRARLQSDPIPKCWEEVSEAVLMREANSTGTLIWYQDCLLLNHWTHGMFHGCDATQLFQKRKIPLNDDAVFKMENMQKFFAASTADRQASAEKVCAELQAQWKQGQLAPTSAFQQFVTGPAERAREYLALDTIRRERFPF